MIAESREKLRRDIAAAERAAKEEGREEGREEAQFVIARKMLRRGRSLDEIMEDTGLSQSEILLLQSEARTRH
jgi:predicted transposase/invertase (TIGR01784 family)